MNADLTAKCAYLFDILKKGEVSCLLMEFNGSNDDGQIEWGDVNYTGERRDGVCWRDPTIFNDYNGKPLRLEALIERITYEITTLLDIDFMNNEGNNGWVRFDVVTGKITTNYRVSAWARKEDCLYV